MTKADIVVADFNSSKVGLLLSFGFASFKIVQFYNFTITSVSGNRQILKHRQEWILSSAFRHNRTFPWRSGQHSHIRRWEAYIGFPFCVSC